MSAPLFLVTVTVERTSNREPAGVLEVRVTREVQAASYADAAEMATEDVLGDLSRLMGGLAGTHIAHVEVTARPWSPG